jgi:hypothetical protein
LIALSHVDEAYAFQLASLVNNVVNGVANEKNMQYPILLETELAKRWMLSV